MRGKALRIEGGDYELAPMPFQCRRCGHRWEQVLSGGAPVDCPNCEDRMVALPAPGGGGARKRGRQD